MNENIKYAVLQPLSGGAYLGTEAAIGHPAEFIISYPGFDAPKFNKDGVLVDAGNEYNLIKYLEKHNRMVPYYQFDRKPFQTDINSEVRLLKDGIETSAPDYSDIDLVVAVPVCSGLSSATTGASNETLDARNCNMMFLARYTLGTIKPKIYIFENAPRLMSAVGASVRSQLELIAHEFGYSIGYYRTDSKWHNNCQKRPRTFVLFFKDDADHVGVPNIGFEHNHISVSELLDKIPKDATQQVTLPMNDYVKSLLTFASKTYGKDWRTNTKSSAVICEVLNGNKLDDWAKFIEEDKTIEDKSRSRMLKGVEHIKNKLSMGLGFYAITPTLMRDDTMPAAMFKTIPMCLHYKEDRLYTMREWLTSMGMPYDFEMYGEPTRYYPKIGQNVPVRTMQFIVSEAARVINDWDSCERITDSKIVLFDNIKQTVTPM